MRYGILLVTHHRIAHEWVKTLESILKEKNLFLPVGISHPEKIQDNRKKIEKALKKVDRGHGVLILTDLFGASPTNLCLPFLKKNKVEMIAGVNLPLLLKIPFLREELSLSEMLQFLQNYGQQHLQLYPQPVKKKS